MDHGDAKDWAEKIRAELPELRGALVWLDDREEQQFVGLDADDDSPLQDIYKQIQSEAEGDEDDEGDDAEEEVP